MAEGKTKEIKIMIPEELLTLVIPEKTIDHFSKAKKELLLAFRSIIDAKIEALEKREGRKVAKKKKIKIE